MLTDPRAHTAIAETMMLLYKDERLRSSLIEKARQAVSEYRLEKTVLDVLGDDTKNGKPFRRLSELIYL